MRRLQVCVARCPDEPLLVGQIVSIVLHDFIPGNAPSEADPDIQVETATGFKTWLRLSDVRPISNKVM